MATESRSLGFIGVGRMGGAMSVRLLDAGYSLCVFDTDRDALRALEARGATVASSPAEVASTAEIILLSLPTPPVVQAVCLGEHGVLNGATVRTVIDCSTTGPGVAAFVARSLQPRNIAWVDAPVSGGIAGAKGGKLAVVVSCTKNALEVVEPILAVLGRIFFTGEKAGLAQTAKLANNLLAATALVVTSEAMVMGVKAGLDPQILLDIFNTGSGRNSATQDKFPRAILTRSFDYGFATALSYKDVRLCVDEAEAMGVPMVVGAAVREMLAITQARFGADSDFTSVARVVEEWAGTQIGNAESAAADTRIASLVRT